MPVKWLLTLCQASLASSPPTYSGYQVVWERVLLSSTHYLARTGMFLAFGRERQGTSRKEARQPGGIPILREKIRSWHRRVQDWPLSVTWFLGLKGFWTGEILVQSEIPPRSPCRTESRKLVPIWWVPGLNCATPDLYGDWSVGLQVQISTQPPSLQGDFNQVTVSHLNVYPTGWG